MPVDSAFTLDDEMFFGASFHVLGQISGEFKR